VGCFAAPAAASDRNSSVVATAARAAATAGGQTSARVDMQAGESTICVRGTGVLSRIVRTTCRTTQEWENRGGLIRG
jgi:putative hemolysin